MCIFCVYVQVPGAKPSPLDADDPGAMQTIMDDLRKLAAYYQNILDETSLNQSSANDTSVGNASSNVSQFQTTLNKILTTSMTPHGPVNAGSRVTSMTSPEPSRPIGSTPKMEPEVAYGIDQLFQYVNVSETLYSIARICRYTMV